MTKIKKILLSAVCLMAAGALLAAAGYVSGGFAKVAVGPGGAKIQNSASPERQISNEHLGSFRSISIQADEADVALKPSDHAGIEIRCRGDSPAPEYQISGGTLRVVQRQSEKAKSAWFHIDLSGIETGSGSSDQITVYLPKSTVFHSIQVSDGSGNVGSSGLTAESFSLALGYGGITVDGGSCGKASVETKSGSISLRGMAASSLRIDNHYGQIALNQVKVTGGEKTELSSGSGDISLSHFEASSVVLTSSYGDVSASSVKAGKFSSQLSSGDFHLQDSVIGFLDITDKYGDITGTGLSSEGTSVLCKSGKIHLSGTLAGENALNSNVGDIVFQTFLPISRYRYAAFSDNGNVFIDGKKAGSQARQNTGAKIR